MVGSVSNNSGNISNNGISRAHPSNQSGKVRTPLSELFTSASQAGENIEPKKGILKKDSHQESGQKKSVSFNPNVDTRDISNNSGNSGNSGERVLGVNFLKVFESASN